MLQVVAMYTQVMMDGLHSIQGGQQAANFRNDLMFHTGIPNETEVHIPKSISKKKIKNKCIYRVVQLAMSTRRGVVGDVMGIILI